MATQTAHFELEKPALTDVADIAVLNNNFDDIDTVMFANQERSVAAVSNQADAYDAAQTYAVGDLVIYENRLYKCTTAVTVAEPWDSTKWEQTTLAESGGTKVEANPVGAAGDTLETIDINGTIYDVGGGKIIHLTQAQYDALPATKESDDKLYLITDTNGDGSHFQPVIYSFEEREIGVWTDGKPLYEKSYIVTTPDTINTVNQIIEVPENSEIVNISGMYDNQFPINFYYDTDNRIETWLNNAKTHVVNRTPYSLMLNLPGIVTLQYTKTTDAPGSGTWTPQGVPALHYSTDEHVIGTWIDGKTLYEKTILFNNETIDANGYVEKQLSQSIYGLDKALFQKIIHVANGDYYELNSQIASTTFANYAITAALNANTLILSRGSSSAITGDFIATIQYTKSTD